MDSRSKIVTPARLPRQAILAAGYFDVLGVEHTRELAAIRDRVPGPPLVAVVLSKPGEIVPQAARAKLVAAVRVVDYVVTADHEDLNRLIESCQASEMVRLDAADQDRTGRLIERVPRSQTR